MAQPLDGVQAKIDHAGEHLDRLRDKLQAFVEPEDPFEVTFRWVDRDKRIFSGHLHIVRPVPLEFGVLVGDVAHDLRSSLDHLVYQVGRLSVRRPRNTQFPIYDSEEAYWEVPPKPKLGPRDQYMDRIPEDHRAFVDREQPYLAPDVGRHPLLWLRALSNMDKHRIVAEVFQRPIQVQLRALSGEVRIEVVIDREDTALVEGSRIFTARVIDKSPDETKIKVDMKTFPAFGDPPLGYDDLVAIQSHVVGIIDRFRPIFT